MNLIVIQTSNQGTLEKIKSLGFVKKQFPIANSIVKFQDNQKDQILSEKFTSNATESRLENVLNYGKSQAQISIHNGAYLHNKGLTGNGIKIAVFDAGFLNTRHTRHLTVYVEKNE